METWYICSGSYPYLAGVKAPVFCLISPYPPVFWQGDGMDYPTCPDAPASCTPVGCFAGTSQLHTVFYNDTTAAFQNISFGTHWRTGAGFDSVICTDGIVTL